MKFYLTGLLLIVFVCASFAQKVNVKKAFEAAGKQTQILLKEAEQASKGPESDLVSPRTV